LNLRVLLEDDWALLGLRLGVFAVAPPCLQGCQPAGIAQAAGGLLPRAAGRASPPGAVVLDPACGAGTILVEAAALVPFGVVCGGDIESSALEIAQANLQAAGISAVLIELNAGFDPRHSKRADNAEQPIALLYQGDATDLRLAGRTVDVVLSNLPWGKQVTAETDLAALYRGILTTIRARADTCWSVRCC